MGLFIFIANMIINVKSLVYLVLHFVQAGQWRCTQFPCVMGAAGCMEVCKSRNELLRHLESHHGIVVSFIVQICHVLDKGLEGNR